MEKGSSNVYFFCYQSSNRNRLDLNLSASLELMFHPVVWRHIKFVLLKQTYKKLALWTLKKKKEEEEGHLYHTDPGQIDQQGQQHNRVIWEKSNRGGYSLRTAQGWPSTRLLCLCHTGRKGFRCSCLRLWCYFLMGLESKGGYWTKWMSLFLFPASEHMCCCLPEIEAKEACDWLRAAGFPQYAQLFEGNGGFFFSTSRTDSSQWGKNVFFFAQMM